jgi:hypothetical protein
MNLPPFNDDGLLPPGDYELTLDEVRESFLVRRSLISPADWDQDWRRYLTNSLEVLVRQLWTVGIDKVFIDGSFVEAKAHPNDIDGYFECDVKFLASGNLQRELNKLDPHKVWTWDRTARRPDPNSAKKQLPMWHRYRVELYPHVGQLTGIRDEFGNDLQFPAAFRKSRQAHKPKGITLLKRSGG